MHNNQKAHIHFIGICGKAMGGIAAALAESGWSITGSDEAHYSPMKEFLAQACVDVRTPYSARNIPDETTIVVVGKRVSENNPELMEVIRKRIPIQSFPEFLREKFLSRSRNAVVAGGVGKTTTSAMLTWILECNSRRPDYLIGGPAKNLAMPARFSGEAFAVLEGDEYASCFHDPRPKFLHYNPEIAIITNIIEDHPDIYPNFENLLAVFASLVETLPSIGSLILSADDPSTAALAAMAPCQVVTVGLGNAAMARIADIELEPHRSSFCFMGTPISLSLCGHMNIRNAAMAIAAAAHWGVNPRDSARALHTFRGVNNRQEERAIGSCKVIYDKASHPFALSGLVQAMRQRHPGKRMVSIIQPRATGGKDWVYQRDLPEVLSSFDKVIIIDAYEHKPQQTPSWEKTPFCINSLANDLTAYETDITLVKHLSNLHETIIREILPDDVILISMSEQSAGQKAIIEEALLPRKRETECRLEAANHQG